VTYLDIKGAIGENDDRNIKTVLKKKKDSAKNQDEPNIKAYILFVACIITKQLF